MRSAFGIEHGVSKGLSPNQLRGLKAVAAQAGNDPRKIYATRRLGAHDIGRRLAEDMTTPRPAQGRGVKVLLGRGKTAQMHIAEAGKHKEGVKRAKEGRTFLHSAQQTHVSHKPVPKTNWQRAPKAAAKTTAAPKAAAAPVRRAPAQEKPKTRRMGRYLVPAGLAAGGGTVGAVAAVRDRRRRVARQATMES